MLAPRKNLTPEFHRGAEISPQRPRRRAHRNHDEFLGRTWGWHPLLSHSTFHPSSRAYEFRHVDPQRTEDRWSEYVRVVSEFCGCADEAFVGIGERELSDAPFVACDEAIENACIDVVSKRGEFFGDVRLVVTEAGHPLEMDFLRPSCAEQSCCCKLQEHVAEHRGVEHACVEDNNEVVVHALVPLRCRVTECLILGRALRDHRVPFGGWHRSVSCRQGHRRG